IVRQNLVEVLCALAAFTEQRFGENFIGSELVGCHKSISDEAIYSQCEKTLEVASGGSQSFRCCPYFRVHRREKLWRTPNIGRQLPAKCRATRQRPGGSGQQNSEV